jgi:hypothetical protein
VAACVSCTDTLDKFRVVRVQRPLIDEILLLQTLVREKGRVMLLITPFFIF